MTDPRRLHHLVEEAAGRIAPYVVRTPLIHSRTFSERFAFPVYLKLENLQVTGAFKLRGAMNALLILQERGVRHVVAASSGSHAMGVALAARISGLRATIFMSENSPEVKREKVRAFGADLSIIGRNYDDSLREAIAFSERHEAALVHGLEDELVSAGHGTMALEIAQDLPEVDLVALPIGGGGAIAGVLTALMADGRRSPDHPVRVWGVQSEGAASMKVSLDRGEPTELPAIKTIADAIAVRRPGRRPFDLVRRLGAGVVTVPDEQLLPNVGRLALWEKVVCEPASAATLAVDWPRVLMSDDAGVDHASRTAPAGHRPRAAAFIITGGNIAPELLLKAIHSA